MAIDILIIGLRDGLLWFPLVLGLGLLYSKLREIDVSVDGVAVVSGLVAGTVWNSTRSYPLSIIVAMCSGAALSGLVSIAAWKTRIGFLMSGIVFSLGCSAASVLWVGESMALDRSILMPGFRFIPMWLPTLALCLGAALEAFLRTNIGIDLRRVGDGVELNSRRSPFRLRCLTAMVAGGGYGLTSALLVHSEGVARSGTGFDFLLVGVCSYLCAARVLGVVSQFAAKMAGIDPHQGISIARGWKRGVIECWKWTSSRALIGAVLFQCVIFAVILKTPNPSAWKLLMALTLFLVLARWPERSTKLQCIEVATPDKPAIAGCSVVDLSYAYDTGTERRPVFTKASGKFPVGLSIVRGSNGAGKSTLIKLLSGQLSPSEGARITPSSSSDYFTVPQRVAETLAPQLTVYENLAAAVPLVDKPPLFPGVSFVSKLLRLSLEKDDQLNNLQTSLSAIDVPLLFTPDDPLWLKPCQDLSGGQALMVALFSAVLARKSVVLLDEPTTGLDTANFERLLVLLRGLSRHRVVIATTHDDRLSVLAPVIVTLSGGKIIFHE